MGAAEEVRDTVPHELGSGNYENREGKKSSASPAVRQDLKKLNDQSQLVRKSS